MKTPLRLVVVALALGVAVAFMAACEGDTFRMDLTNDTQEPLEFRLCSADCNRFHLESRIEPGKHRPTNFAVGILSYWQVQDEEGAVLGCFRIYEPDERPELRVLYVSKDLVPCP
jgi:hypothetical protein